MMEIPRGTRQSNGTIKIAVSFPEELFKRLVARARSTKTSFSAVVSDAAACGLLDLEDYERHELEQITPRI